MRILIILHQFFPEFAGGTEQVALNLARSAQRAGHHVQVLSCAVKVEGDENDFVSNLVGAVQRIHDGVPITLLPRGLLPVTADFSFDCDMQIVGAIENWLVSAKFDVAHVIHPMRMSSALLAVQRVGLPYLVTLTDFYFGCFRINLVNLEGELCPGPAGGSRCSQTCRVAPWDAEGLRGRFEQGRDILAGAGVLVCPSEYVAGRFRTIFPELEFSVIAHGVDLLAIAARISVRRDVSKAIIFGFIGTIVPQKGLDVLLRAFSEIPGKDLKLVVAGGLHGDLHHCEAIESMVKADSRVEMLGQISSQEVRDILQTLDVLCLPSRVPETFSLILHEAFACGVPALVSNLGAPGETVLHHGSGRVIEAGNVRQWRDAIAEIIAAPEILQDWQQNLPLPSRLEEEGFFYDSHYKRLRHPTNGSAARRIPGE